MVLFVRIGESFLLDRWTHWTRVSFHCGNSSAVFVAFGRKIAAVSMPDNFIPQNISGCFH